MTPPTPPPGHPDTEPVAKPADSPAQAAERRRSERATWLGVVAPPALLLLQIGVNYALVPWACRTGHVWVIHLVSLCCLAGALGGTAFSFATWTALGHGGARSGAGTLENARFVSLGGLALSLGIALAILAVALPTFVLGPCD
jgi:hypothetical protein